MNFFLFLKGRLVKVRTHHLQKKVSVNISKIESKRSARQKKKMNKFTSKNIKEHIFTSQG
jgi:hypothetical protein